MIDPARRFFGSRLPRKPRRVQEVLALVDYTPIGDGRSVAMSGIDGSIDWWAVDGIDRPPLFDRLLGGRSCFVLQPAVPFRITRRYRPDSNVLETVFITATGRARLTESLNSGLAGRLPWSELARRIDGLEGRVAFRLRLELRSTQGDLALEPAAGGMALTGADLNASLQVDPRVRLRRIGPSVTGRFTVDGNDRVLIALTAKTASPIAVTPITSIDGRIDESDSQWRRWANKLTYDGLYSAEVRRSALVLKLLLYSPSGAIAAAATTSLPERIGGGKNWDYRFAWVRDVAYSIKALLRVGAYEEAQAALSWLFDTVRRHGPSICVFYRLDGSRAGAEQRGGLPGYRGSKPVRDGNAALSQRQLGLYGDILIAARDFVDKGHRLDRISASLLVEVADRAVREWKLRDSGIWELQEQAHYTNSKIGCWTALDVAVSLAARGELPRTRVRAWQRGRDEIHQWIERHCWSESRQAYVMAAGSHKLDAALLLAAPFGYPERERLDRTRRAIQAELGRGELLYRYSGMEHEEGCFIACSFWCVETLAMCGHREAARDMMDGLLKLAGSDNGAYHEMMDPASGAMLGNFPQGLSHLAMIHAAEAVSNAFGVPT